MQLQHGFACYECQINYTLRKTVATYSRNYEQNQNQFIYISDFKSISLSQGYFKPIKYIYF